MLHPDIEAKLQRLHGFATDWKAKRARPHQQAIGQDMLDVIEAVRPVLENGNGLVDPEPAVEPKKKIVRRKIKATVKATVKKKARRR